MKNIINNYIRIILITITTTFLYDAAAQDCASLETATYSGETTKGSFDAYGSASSVAFTKVADDQLKISDFSAGFLSNFGRAVVEVTLNVNCDGSIEPITFSTEAGETTITGGLYTNTELRLDWEIPFNNLVEESIFTKN
ncbi:hypothetical protein [Ekhidna sp.]